MKNKAIHLFFIIMAIVVSVTITYVMYINWDMIKGNHPVKQCVVLLSPCGTPVYAVDLTTDSLICKEGKYVWAIQYFHDTDDKLKGIWYITQSYDAEQGNIVHYNYNEEAIVVKAHVVWNDKPGVVMPFWKILLNE